jgi:hypothetical protein
MATIGYNPPGVRITELTTPTVAPIFERPTNIALVGEALGYQSIVNESVYLEDNDWATLKVPGVNANTIVVKDSFNTGTTYVVSTDYEVGADGDFTRIRRRIYSTIESGEGVVVILWTTGDTSKTRLVGNDVSNGVALTGSSTYVVSAPTADALDQVVVQRKGAYNTTTDYQATVSGTTSAKVYRRGGSRIADGQKVYVTYTTAAGANTYTDEEVTLTGTSAPANPGNLSHYGEGVDLASIVVRNAKNMGTDATAVVQFSLGATSDYTQTIDNGATPTPTVSLTRTATAPTTIGSGDGRRTVKVSYQATTKDYWRPARFFSFSEVETMYGPAMDVSTGVISSPLSFAAFLAFANGAPDIVAQAVFHTSDINDSQAERSGPTAKTDMSNYIADWRNSFQSLRDFSDVNIIVPVIGQTSQISDSNVVSVFSALQDHVGYMAENDEHIVVLLGEDSTATGSATLGTLQSHAKSLGAHEMAERTTLISPANFAFPNSNLTRGYVAVGGQYVAASMAGMLAARPVQDTLTRKSVVGFIDVLDYRSTPDKNNDAQAGLTVIERKNGNVNVRHAITTAVSNINSQELVRAKLYMVESIRRTLDARIVGQIPADDNAPTIVGATVQGVLETLVQSGAIVSFSSLQARSLGPGAPATIEVRFGYKPSYPLNYVDVVFSVDVSSGSSTTFGV